MTADLDKIRALLASVEGFTKGPWSARRNGGYLLIRSKEELLICGFPSHHEANAALFAAGPDLHRDLSEAADEIERLRAQVATLVAHRDRMAEMLNVMARGHSKDDAHPFWTAVERHLGTASISSGLRALAAGEVSDG